MRFDEQYETVMASDLQHDGMWLELWERQGARELAMTAFYSDSDGSLKFERYRSDIPQEIEEWFQQEARRRLPKSPDA